MKEEEETDSPQKAKRKSVVSAKRLDRAFKVFELRKNGGSFRAIANTLKKQAEDAGESTRGFSHTQVKADYELAIAIKTENLADSVTEARVLTAERLDDIYLRISPLIANGKNSMKIKAAGVLIRANKEYAEIHGVKRTIVQNPDGTPIAQPIAEVLSQINKGLDKVYGTDDEDSENPSETA